MPCPVHSDSASVTANNLKWESRRVMRARKTTEGSTPEATRAEMCLAWCLEPSEQPTKEGQQRVEDLLPDLQPNGSQQANIGWH